MDLKKFLPGQESKETREYYWSLAIEPGWVQAGIWRIENGEAQILFSGHPSPWEEEEDLVTATDASLSAAIQNFPEDAKEPSKTVFGVVSSWVSGGQIKEEYLAVIKKVCAELSLKPVGFVVISEGISHFYRTEEGTPLNAVILGVYKDNLELSVFNLGNLAGNTTVARSVTLADDVVEGLTRFAANDTIPSRFILYNGKDTELEEYRQSLIDVNWDEISKLKFLHTPKVEIVDSQRKIQAISLAGASEMGDVTSVSTFKPKQQVIDNAEELAKEIPSVEEVSGEEDVPHLEQYGFVLDNDIAKDELSSQNNPSLSPETKNISEEAGIPHNSNTEDIPSRSQTKFKISTNPLAGLAVRKPSLPHFSLPKFGGFFAGTKIFIIGMASLAFIIAGSLFLWWYYPKAVVTIYLSPRTLNEKVDLTVNPSLDYINVETKVLPGKKITQVVDGEKTKSATGTKTIGDKAKGEISIYRVGTELKLQSGTFIRGPGNLRFSLDENVTVASGSAATPGVVKVGVSAEDIGTQYNLESGNSFSVGNYSMSDMEAKNESGFKGGTSKEIRVVSEDDQKELLLDLEKELKDKAAQNIQNSLSDTKIFISDSLTLKEKSKTFSAKVGEETSSVKLELTSEADAFTVERSELVQLARSILLDKIPDGYTLRDEQIAVKFDYKVKTGDNYVFESQLEANLLPLVDTDEVADRISGKYTDLAKDYLSKEVPGFSEAVIVLKPALPGRLGTLPRIAKNIEVEIAVER